MGERGERGETTGKTADVGMSADDTMDDAAAAT
jgi:hypothetical protein